MESQRGRIEGLRDRGGLGVEWLAARTGRQALPVDAQLSKVGRERFLPDGLLGRAGLGRLMAEKVDVVGAAARTRGVSKGGGVDGCAGGKHVGYTHQGGGWAIDGFSCCGAPRSGGRSPAATSVCGTSGCAFG